MSLRYFHIMLTLVFTLTALLAPPADAVPTAEALAPVKQKLDKQIKLQLLQVPLERALEFLQSESGVPFIIDRASLTPHLKTHIELTVEQITIHDALELALAQIGWSNVDWDVRNGRVYVSTPGNVIKPHLRTQVYDVRALTMHVVDFTEEPQIGLQAAGGYNSGGGGGGQSLFSDSSSDSVDVAGFGALDELIRLSIRNGTHDGNWEIPGVSIQQNAGLLLVVNTPEVHDAIADLLTKYQAASGKMISVNARFVLVKTDALDTFIAQQPEQTLVLNPQQVTAFRNTVAHANQGARLLGTTRTVCFNSQRVYVAAGNEQVFVADLDPVVGTRSAAFDPQIDTMANMTVLSVQPTAGVDNQHISTTIRGGLAIGNGVRIREGLALKGIIDRGTDDPIDDPDGDDRDDRDDESNASALPAPQAKDIYRVHALEKGEVAERAELTPIDSTIIELPEQDSVHFRTSARIPNGGGVILAGSSNLYRHFDAPEGTEIVLLIQASVVK